METNQIFKSDLERYVPGLSIRLRLHYTHLLLLSKPRYNILIFSGSGANSYRPTLTCGKRVVASPTSINRNMFGNVDELLQIASNVLKAVIT